MRCRCCDKALTDMESKAKDSTSGNYLDICRKCREWALGGVMDNIGEDEQELINLIKTLDRR